MFVVRPPKWWFSCQLPLESTKKRGTLKIKTDTFLFVFIEYCSFGPKACEMRFGVGGLAEQIARTSPLCWRLPGAHFYPRALILRRNVGVVLRRLKSWH